MGITDKGGESLFFGPYWGRDKWLRDFHGGKWESDFHSGRGVERVLKVVRPDQFDKAVAVFKDFFHQSPYSEGPAAASKFDAVARKWATFRVLEAHARKMPPFSLVQRDLGFFRQLVQADGVARLVPLHAWKFPDGFTGVNALIGLEIRGRRGPYVAALIGFTPTNKGLAIDLVQGIKGKTAPKEQLGGKEWQAYLMDRVLEAQRVAAPKAKLHFFGDYYGVYPKIYAEYGKPPLNPFPRLFETVHTTKSTKQATRIRPAAVRMRRRIRKARDTLKRAANKLRRPR